VSASIRDVKRRIRSISSTEQITQAMKTVALSKYNRVQTGLQAFLPYEAACRDILSRMGSARLQPPEHAEPTVCYVVITANRGLCGSFNMDLIRFLEVQLAREGRPYFLAVCGKWGRNLCQEGRLSGVRKFFPAADLPEYGQAEELAAWVTELITTGKATEIRVVSQHFVNLLKQQPENVCLFPCEDMQTADDGEEILCLPDRETVLRTLQDRCLASRIYGLLLSAAAGAHAAMLVAMRAASDSSSAMLEELTLHYNRLRQAAVTTEVLELAGGMEERMGG